MKVREEVERIYDVMERVKMKRQRMRKKVIERGGRQRMRKKSD